MVVWDMDYKNKIDIEKFTSRGEWELEHGVTDTRRFDDIPFMDEDEFNLTGNKIYGFSTDLQGCKSKAEWELEFGVTDTLRFGDIPFIDEDENESKVTPKGEFNITSNIDIQREESNKVVLVTSVVVNSLTGTTKTGTKPSRAATETRVQNVMMLIKTKVQKLTKERRVLLEGPKSWRNRLTNQFKACVKH